MKKIIKKEQTSDILKSRASIICVFIFLLMHLIVRGQEKKAVSFWNMKLELSSEWSLVSEQKSVEVGERNRDRLESLTNKQFEDDEEQLLFEYTNGDEKNRLNTVLRDFHTIRDRHLLSPELTSEYTFKYIFEAIEKLGNEYTFNYEQTSIDGIIFSHSIPTGLSLLTGASLKRSETCS
ncbi:MAG: hypothetical protein ACJAWV_003622 [Flammeovirgaceae bacterium]|jgi:hypothetical protein